ncbi:MAG: GAF domain-containing protein [Spirochaetaceae bacterium]|nr:GAF domain-containing protein [Spirochaetaceae bacterium]
MEQTKDLQIPEDFMEKWQNVVNTATELIGIPAGLIMRIVDTDIQVFVSSHSKGNPYKPGDSEVLLNSGLYCERVIETGETLHVPDALKDDEWKNNPDIKLNMISYLGFPILLPDDHPFGTICVLDNKENHFSETIKKVMDNFREIIENDLKTIYMNWVLGEENKKLVEFIAEMQYLRGILRICAHCKKIKDENDQWINLEAYIESHSEAEFSHGLCEVCAEEIYGNKPWFEKQKDPK